MLDVFLIATIVALILLAAVGLDRIVCHVIKRKRERYVIGRTIDMLCQSSVEKAEDILIIMERIKTIENKLAQGDKKQ